MGFSTRFICIALLIALTTGCASDSHLLWSFKTAKEVAPSPALGADGTIYIGSHDNFFYALNPDGKIKWKIQAEGWVHASPAIADDGTIYFGAYDDYVYAATPDGKIKWRVRV